MGVLRVAAFLAALLLFTTADVPSEDAVPDSDDVTIVLCENKQCFPDKIMYGADVQDTDDSFQNLDEEFETKPFEQSLDFETIYKPIELAHEVQLNDQYASSGEQFVAVRRDSNIVGDWCAGCPTDISVDADGVTDLANKAVQHLDRHRLNEKHSLQKILRVQRQAQIVNGVRYILLLEIETTTCNGNVVDETCQDSTKEISTCQVTFLEKPWLRLNDGSKFRAVISNNCTEEFIFGDEGEAINENQVTDPNANNEINGNPDSDIAKVVYNNDLQAVQKPEVNQEITAERLKNVEDQIISDTDSVKTEDIYESRNENVEAIQQRVVIENTATNDFIANPVVEESNVEVENAANVQETVELVIETTTAAAGLTDEQKQAIEGMLDLFNYDEARLDNDDLLKTPNKRNANATVNSSSSESSEEKQSKSKAIKKASSEEVDSSEEKVTSTIKPSIVRMKRSLRGRNNSELDKLNIESLAKFAVDTLDDFDSDNSKRVVLDILSADKAYQSSNTIYFLKLKVGLSKCDESMQHKCETMLIEGKTKTCHVQIEVKPNGDKKVVKSHCVNKDYPLKRSKREMGLVGGPSAITLPNKKIENLAQFALQEYDLKSSHENKHLIVKIISATKKIVSGVSTSIKFEARESNCPKTNTEEEPKCEFLQNSIGKICIATVWEKPWLKQKDVSIKCEPISLREKRDDFHKHSFKKLRDNHNSRTVPGGLKPIDLSDPIVDELAKLSLYKFDVLSSSGNHHKIIRVLSATTQVVAGKLTKINFEVKRSNCTKEDIDNDEVCEFLDHGRTKMCKASIWDRPWIENGKEIKIDCEPIETPNVKDLELEQFDRLRSFLNETKLFGDFLAKYKKPYTYDHNEFRRRFKIFQENLAIIKELNEKEQGSAVYGITMFADLSQDEFRNNYLGLRRDLHNENAIPWPQAEIPEMDDIPTEFDWREKGAVTPVKNQGSCGSCWAFSVTGNVEGQWKIKNGNLLSLSEQELVDCDKLDSGCNGGLPDNAYRAIEELGGLELESDYPYDAEDEKCSFNKTMAKVQISGAVNISSNETDMAKWLVSNGPISIGINANGMQFYVGGVSHPYKFLCNPDNLDHGVLIVGYGVHDYSLFKKKLPYWIVKNSWGPSWGEKGYYRVYRGDGTCGLNNMASSSII